MKIPLRLKVYIAAVSGLAAVLGAAAAAFDPASWRPVDFFYAAFLMAMIAIAGRFPLQIRPKTKSTVTTAAITAAVLLLPPPITFVICGAGKAIAQIGQKGPLLQKTFNVASTMASAALAG